MELIFKTANRCKPMYPLEVEMGRKTLTIYPNRLAKGIEFSLLFSNGGIIAYEGKVIDFIGYDFQSGALILDVEITKDYEVPNEYYTVSEQTGSCVYRQIGWYHTEEEALEEYNKLDYGQINKGGPNSYGMLITHRKTKEEWE